MSFVTVALALFLVGAMIVALWQYRGYNKFRKRFVDRQKHIENLLRELIEPNLPEKYHLLTMVVNDEESVFNIQSEAKLSKMPATRVSIEIDWRNGNDETIRVTNCHMQRREYRLVNQFNDAIAAAIEAVKHHHGHCDRELEFYWS